MEPTKLLAQISRQFLVNHSVNQYRMKKVIDMVDEEVIFSCHFFCEENGLIKDFNEFRGEEEAKYCYCSYLEEYIDHGLCCDLQMITGGYIKPSALPEITVDKEECSNHCSKCKYFL